MEEVYLELSTGMEFRARDVMCDIAPGRLKIVIGGKVHIDVSIP